MWILRHQQLLISPSSFPFTAEEQSRLLASVNCFLRFTPLGSATSLRNNSQQLTPTDTNAMIQAANVFCTLAEEMTPEAFMSQSSPKRNRVGGGPDGGIVDVDLTGGVPRSDMVVEHSGGLPDEFQGVRTKEQRHLTDIYYGSGADGPITEMVGDSCVATFMGDRDDLKLRFPKTTIPNPDHVLAARLGRLGDFRALNSPEARLQWLGRGSDLISRMSFPGRIRDNLVTGKCATLRDYALASSSLGSKRSIYTIEGVSDAFTQLELLYERMYGSDHELAASFRKIRRYGVLVKWYTSLLAEAEHVMGNRSISDSTATTQSIAANHVLSMFDARLSRWQDNSYDTLINAFKEDSRGLAGRVHGAGIVSASIRYSAVPLRDFYEDYIAPVDPTLPMSAFARLVPQPESGEKVSPERGRHPKRNERYGPVTYPKVEEAQRTSPTSRPPPSSVSKDKRAAQKAIIDLPLDSELPPWFADLLDQDLGRVKSILGMPRFAEVPNYTTGGKKWCVIHVSRPDGCTRAKCWDEFYHQDKHASKVKTATRPAKLF
jgi:hypothetical protein